MSDTTALPSKSSTGLGLPSVKKLVAFGVLCAAAASFLAPGPKVPEIPLEQQVQTELIQKGDAIGNVHIDYSRGWDVFDANRKAAFGLSLDPSPYAQSVGGVHRIQINSGYSVVSNLIAPSRWGYFFDSHWQEIEDKFVFLHERSHVHYATAMPRLADGPPEAAPFINHIEQRALARFKGNSIQNEMFSDCMAATWLIRMSDPKEDAYLKDYLKQWMKMRDGSALNGYGDYHASSPGLKYIVEADWGQLRVASPAASERFAMQASTAGFLRQMEVMKGHFGGQIGKNVDLMYEQLSALTKDEKSLQWLSQARAGTAKIDPPVQGWVLPEENIKALKKAAEPLTGDDPLASRDQPVRLGSMAMRLADYRLSHSKQNSNAVDEHSEFKVGSTPKPK